VCQESGFEPYQDSYNKTRLAHEKHHIQDNLGSRYYICQSEPTRLTRVGSPRVGFEIVELNPAHFLVSQKFSNPAQPTTGWWVKWVGSPTRIEIIKKLKKIIFVIFFLLFFYLLQNNAYKKIGDL